MVKYTIVLLATSLVSCGGGPPAPEPKGPGDSAVEDAGACPPDTVMACENGDISTCDAGHWAPCPSTP